MVHVQAMPWVTPWASHLTFTNGTVADEVGSWAQMFTRRTSDELLICRRTGIAVAITAVLDYLR